MCVCARVRAHVCVLFFIYMYIFNLSSLSGHAADRNNIRLMRYCDVMVTHNYCYSIWSPPLGVIFDRKLSFIPHLKYVKKKALKALNILKVIGNTEWGADRKVMIRLYRSLIRSKLDYGCIVYGSARKSYLQMLDPIHNQGLRLCLGAFRTSPVDSLYVDAHEPCLGARRARLSLQYASKIKSLPKHPAHNAVFDNKYMKLFDARPDAIRTFGFRIK